MPPAVLKTAGGSQAPMFLKPVVLLLANASSPCRHEGAALHHQHGHQFTQTFIL